MDTRCVKNLHEICNEKPDGFRAQLFQIAKYNFQYCDILKSRSEGMKFKFS